MPVARGFRSSADSKLRLRDVELAVISYPPNLAMPRHWHEPAYVSCVLAGSYDERIGATARNVTAPAVLLHPREEEHSVSFGGAGARILNIQLGEDTLRCVRDHGIKTPIEDWRQTPEADWLVAKIYTEFSRKDPASRLALDGLVLELLASGFRAAPKPACQTAVQRAKEYLEAHFAEPVSLDDVALAVSVHSVYLSRAFRRATGMTVGDYVRRLRIEGALRLVQKSDLSLAEIALEVGFSDQPHLTRVFKTHTGTTPSRYRKAYAQG